MRARAIAEPPDILIKPDMRDAMPTAFDRVMDEDFENLAPIQRSLESPGLGSIALSYQERRIYHWHEQIDRMIGPERLPPGLAVESLLAPFVEGSIGGE